MKIKSNFATLYAHIGPRYYHLPSCWLKVSWLRICSLNSCRLTLLVFAGPLLGQTLINEPEIDVIAEGRSPSSVASLNTALTAEAPIPVSLVIAMPYIGIDATLSSEIDVDNTKTQRQSFQIGAGMLHHASEGAPLWKLETGRMGSFEQQGLLYGKGSLNLEKLFPALRPHNSDKLEAWIGGFSVVGPFHKLIALPEIGWKWTGSEHWYLDFIGPRRLKIGYQKDNWVASLVWRQDILVTIDDEKQASEIRCERKRFILVETTRKIGLGLSVAISAGLRLPGTPAAGVNLSWIPSD
ncbi:MAG: hypothetical protein NTV34_17595 [Proteobacteria bacterium]|nr:hypothetical protein [Pseudomonadota bacterium]